MWYIVEQDKIKALNDAVNDQWAFIIGLEDLARWDGSARSHTASEAMRDDLVQLRENTENISAALNEAILWEGT